MTHWSNRELFGTIPAFSVGVNTTASHANQLERRLIGFAAAIVALSSRLPKTPQGRHICGQILRSGTAAAANYGEARGAESRADFIHKLKVVFKELNEPQYGLKSSLQVPAFAGKHCRDCRGKPRTL